MTSRLDSLCLLVKEATSMAPLNWEYTDRFNTVRIECANGNVILEAEKSDRTIYTSEEMELLVTGVNHLPGLIRIAAMAKEALQFQTSQSFHDLRDAFSAFEEGKP